MIFSCDTFILDFPIVLRSWDLFNEESVGRNVEVWSGGLHNNNIIFRIKD